ncbi:MAG: V-type ATPase 116kDa subunit family protein [Bacteroidales bacterium]|nr:V-type ATPase 116kDa subunit family protein [Bacteroidales bacterium]
MKKYSFLVYHNDYREFLSKLGELGVLHVIESKGDDREESLREYRKDIEVIDKALGILNISKEKISKGDTGDAADAEPDHAKSLIRLIEETGDNISRLEKQADKIRREINKVLPWGEYTGEDIAKLKATGYIPEFYHCKTSKYDPRWEEEYNLFHITEQDGKVYFLVLSKEDEKVDIDADKADPGELAPHELREELQAVEKECKEEKQKLEELKKSAVPVLLNYRRQLENNIRFREVYLETHKASDDKLMILEGWVPEEAEEKVQTFIKDNDVVSVANSPSEEDRPPVKLKNTRFSRLFEPISELFDLPAYNELDLTPYFAPFFMLFFGFCLGDAGYGVFFILFAGLLKLKADKRFKPLLSLAQYFGVATIIFGLLSGTFFGINLIDSGYTITDSSIERLKEADIPGNVITGVENMKDVYYESRSEFLEAAKKSTGQEAVNSYEAELLKQAEAGIPFIRSFRHLMQEPLSMFYLAIIIGGMQILFGIFVKIMNITRRQGFRYALSTVGWLLLIITLIIYYSGLVEKDSVKYPFYGLLTLSGILIFLLNKPGVNIFSRIGSGIWDSYGMVTGLFGDLLSYIRLFALGISSAILGFVFNDISLQLLNIPYIGWLFFLIILLAGHSINIFLASLGGFIHPMRLTFVEFYKNADFKGGGKKYKPFIINN